MTTVPPTLRGDAPPTSATDWEPWIGYIRVSTWKEEKISPELQETALRAWALRTRRRLIEPLIVDLDMTGRNFKRKIMSGIERIERGEARGIGVWKYSRFGRSRDGIAINLKRLEDAGGELASATEEGDARTATGRLQRGILFEFAAYESDVRGEQWRETHDHRRYKLHLPATGRPRFGYLWTPRRVPDPAAPNGIRLQEETYAADPASGPAMAEQYRQYIDGAAYYSLVADLNSRGWRTVRGGLWSEQTLIRYMDSGFSAGLLRVHDPACRCGPDARRRCTNTMFIPGAQEELISADIWQDYQDRREEMRATPPRARTALYPLSGLTRCGGCHGTTPMHSAMRGPAGRKVRVLGYSYQCGRRSVTGTHGCRGVFVRREAVEDAVRAWLTREIAPDIDAAAPTPLPDPRAEQRAQRETAARERERLHAEADKLTGALATLRAQRALEPEEWGPGEYEGARDRIRGRQAAVLAALDRATVTEATPLRADFAPFMLGLLTEWSVLDIRHKNALLRRAIRRIALTRAEGRPVEVQVHPMWEPDPWEDAPPSVVCA